MMDKEEKDIKALFAPLATGKLTSASGWAAMEKGLKAQNFKKFGFTHFNMYFLIIAASIVISGIGYSLSGITTHNSQMDGDLNQTNTEQILTNQELNVVASPESKALVNSTESVDLPREPLVVDEPGAPIVSNAPKSTIIEEVQEMDEIPTPHSTIYDNKEPDITDTKHQPENVMVNEEHSTEDNISFELDKKKKTVHSKTVYVIEETYDTIVKIDTQYVEKRGFFRR